MNADAHAFAIALDRTVTRELRYRHAIARAAWAESHIRVDRPAAANDAAMPCATNDAPLPRAAREALIYGALRSDSTALNDFRRAARVHRLVLAGIATLLVIATLIA